MGRVKPRLYEPSSNQQHPGNSRIGCKTLREQQCCVVEGMDTPPFPVGLISKEKEHFNNQNGQT